MEINEIPLSPDNQKFTTLVNGTLYGFLLVWRDSAGWVIDLLESGGDAIITGIPLVTGANLLAPYAHLNLGFALIVVCDDPAQDDPTKTDLGINSHLLAVTE